jgi:hypothetical protein
MQRVRRFEGAYMALEGGFVDLVASFSANVGSECFGTPCLISKTDLLPDTTSHIYTVHMPSAVTVDTYNL